MATTFLVDGTEYKLSIYKNGIDYSADLIGNWETLIKKDDEGRYIATMADYQWWDDLIGRHAEMDAMIDEYREKYGDQTVDDVIAAAGCSDLDQMVKLTISGLKQLDD